MPYFVLFFLLTAKCWGQFERAWGEVSYSQWAGGIGWVVDSPAEDHSGWRALNSTSMFCSLSPTPASVMKAGGWWKRCDVRGSMELQKNRYVFFLSVVLKCLCVWVCLLLFYFWLSGRAMHTHVQPFSLFCYTWKCVDIPLIFFLAVMTYCLSFPSSDLLIPSAIM